MKQSAAQNEKFIEGAKEYSKIKKGEYSTHIYLEETRGLTHPTDNSSSVDPVIYCEVFGQKKHSSQKEDRGPEMTYWGEHLFFTKNFPEKQEFELEKFKIKVYDYNLIGSSALIGQFEMDVVTVYLAENHSILHRWIALINYQNNVQEIKGFLKFSINIFGEGEEQITLEDEKSIAKKKADTDFDPSNILMPPQIKSKNYQLKISLIRAQNLPVMDSFLEGGSIDCFIVLEFANSTWKTKTQKNNRDPVWGKHILLPFSEPNISDFLTIKVYDEDKGNKDDILGSAAFLKKDIMKKIFNRYFWMNLYGANLYGKGRFYDIMLSNTDLGSTWMGRLLIKIDAYECENPKLGQEQIEQKTMDLFSDPDEDDDISWQLNCELYYGLNFPKDNEYYSVEVTWADEKIVFKSKKPKGKVWEWYQRKIEKFDFPYQSSEELPDVIIYLVDSDGYRVCYYRKNCEILQRKLASDPTLFYLKPDKSISPYLSEDTAGILKMRITVGQSYSLQDLSVGKWNKEISFPDFSKEAILIANIYQVTIHCYRSVKAQNLIPADDDGTSDPYAVVLFYGKQETTKYVENSLNPLWVERKTIETNIFPLSNFPPIIIMVYDKDLIGQDFIGSAIISVERHNNLSFFAKNTFEPPPPKWFTLKYTNVGKLSETGKILASFNYIDKQMKINIPKSLPPLIIYKKKYYIKIKILGLRNLKSLGAMEVKKAFIKFDLNSLRQSEEKIYLEEKKFITTQPKQFGPNPNIISIIDFQENLPIVLDYCPTLSCIVYDNLLLGLLQPVIGIFSIDLAKYIERSQKRLNKIYNKVGKAFHINKNLNLINDDISKIEISEISNNENKKMIEIHQNDSKQKLFVKQKTPLLKRISKEAKSKLNKLFETKSKYNHISENDESNDEKGLKNTLIPRVVDENNKINSEFIVIPAKYTFSNETRTMIESNIPDPENYIGLGYDTNEDRELKKSKKHYRYFIKTCLEKSKFLNKSVFDEISIMRGSRIQEDSIFLNILKQEHRYQKVGTFKGWIDIISEEDYKYMSSKEKNILLSTTKKNYIQSFQKEKSINLNKIDSDFLNSVEVMIKVYIIKITNLKIMDLTSKSDPFIKIVLGDQVIDDEDNYKDDLIEADIYKEYQIKTKLPGSSLLQVQIWDYDPLFSNELIGETLIDLENRFFSKQWKKLIEKPIEERDIFHPLSRLSRGKVSLWVDIIPLSERQQILYSWDIASKPSSEFEIRVVIWDCEDVPSMDVEDTSDIYVTGRIGDIVCTTDTHYRAQNGYGSFNWRFLFKVTLPINDPTISFQIWDKDILSRDDFISSATYSFETEAKRAFENDCKIRIYGKSSRKEKKPKKFDIDLVNVEKKGYKLQKERGTLTVSFEIIPIKMAEKNKVGEGRSDPNHDPWLPPPVGRIQWTMNLFKMFTQLVGPRARRKIYIACCLTCLISICVTLAPIILGNLMTKALTS